MHTALLLSSALSSGPNASSSRSFQQSSLVRRNFMRPFSSFARMQRLAVAVLVFFVPVLLSAATYIVPPDSDLIREADAIAIVTIQSSHSYFADDGSIDTDYAAIVENSLKGTHAAGASIVLTQRGGSI